MSESECLRFTDKTFQKEVLESNQPVFVDFWGSWCPPCKMVEPVMDELARRFNGRIKVGKLNVDQNPQTRSMFDIGGAPTFILFKNGQVLGRVIGARSKKQLVEFIENALKSQSSKTSKQSKSQDVERSA